MGNRLGSATSPYLLQHSDNPVDWWEWGDEAVAEARRRDVPLLVSVGYSACHWCHVMAAESFADEAVAGVVNAEVVPVKVDREERPDVDAVYMTATQAMTGQGGWPMTVFATPDGEPFWCGTYLPREQFVAVVRAVGEAWRERRGDVVRQGGAVADAVRAATAPPAGTDAMGPEVLDAAAEALRGDYDTVHGGFGGAPKFPPSMVLEFLLRHHARTGDAQAVAMTRETCDRMARGGMYDQLGGGFARYAVDATWTVPHFEKMLYDNALLLRAYTHLWRDTGDPLARRVAAETAGFLLTDLRAGPAFAASLDADTVPAGAAEGETHGVEGLTYVWTPEQLRAALGPADGDWAADVFGVTGPGTFEHGTSVLRLPADPDDTDRWHRVREALRAARAGRPQPGRDDKVVAAWNGLAVTALAEYAMVADAIEPGTGGEALAAARDAAAYLLDTHLVDGRLRRVSRGGVVGAPAGVLEDHGCLAAALCVLHQADGAAGWLAAAEGLLDTALARFDNGAGGFFDTADDAERLVSRPADPTDNATPSGLSALAEALASFSALTGRPRYREAAERAVAVLTPVARRYPRFAGHALAVAEGLAAGPHQVAVVGGSGAAELRRAAWRAASPGAVVVCGRPDAPGVPLLADRPLVAGGPAAYVCRGFVCDRPVTTAAGLTESLNKT